MKSNQNFTRIANNLFFSVYLFFVVFRFRSGRKIRKKKVLSYKMLYDVCVWHGMQHTVYCNHKTYGIKTNYILIPFTFYVTSLKQQQFPIDCYLKARQDRAKETIQKHYLWVIIFISSLKTLYRKYNNKIFLFPFVVLNFVDWSHSHLALLCLQ